MLDVPDFPDTHNRDVYKPLPHDIDLEQAILGALLVENRLYEITSTQIEKEHFFDPLHSHLYEMIGRAIGEARRADPVTLRAEADKLPAISDDVTVGQYLSRLSIVAATPPALRSYCTTLRDLAARRAIISSAYDLIANAYDTPLEVPGNELIALAEQQLFAVAEGHKSIDGQVFELKDAVDAALTEISEARKHGGKISGLPTGLLDLDKFVGGLQRSDFIVLAGRPAMGKTALALNIAAHVSALSTEESPQHVHFFSLEMSASQLATRMISEKAEVAGHMLRRGDISEDVYRGIHDVAQIVKAQRMTIDQTGGITLASLASRARRIKRKHGTTLLVIDYLQLLTGSGKRNANRVQEITEITTGLKALAKELNVPIVALSQLSRKVEERADKRPQLADLRESGSIEQDADVVMFVYREEYYVNNEKGQEEDPVKYGAWMGRMERCRGKAEVIIGKHRHGPVGTVYLAFENEYTRFGNLAKSEGSHV